MMKELYLMLPYIVSLGAFQGILLSIILGFNKKYSVRPNHFFALLVLTISVINIYGALDILQADQGPLFEDYIPYFWSSLIPPSVYFFIKYLTKPSYVFKKTDYLFFLPLAIDIVYQFSHFINFLWNGPYSDTAYHRFNYVGDLFELFASVFSIAVFAYSIREIDRLNQRVKDNFSNIEKLNFAWVKRFLIGGLFISICWVVVSFLNVYPGVFLKPLAIFVWLSVTVLIYWTAYSMLNHRELLEMPQLLSSEQLNTNEVSKKISPDEASQLQLRLQQIISAEKPFLNPNLTLRDLADLNETTDKKLSALFNQHLNTNFYDFVNQCRIEAFKKKIENGEGHNLSMVGLANECGFKSKSSFYRSFKKNVGMTPTEYLKHNSL